MELQLETKLKTKEDFFSTKKELLHDLQGKKTKYKRMSLSTMRYAGGKSLAVGYVLEHLPEVKRVISPFFGGGSIEIAMTQKLGIEIVASDILQPLTIYWQEQISNPKKLHNALKKLEPNKEVYKEVKEKLKKWWNGELRLTDLQVATYYYYNHNLSYGPSFLGWPSSVYMNEKKYTKMLERVRDFKGNISITNEPFENLFKKYPNDFFYCDPPYFLKDNDKTSQMFAGIYPQRNFPIHHKQFDHEKLRDCLQKHKGGFILSYNDCEKSREYYKKYKLEYPTWQYTMGQGETRISKNRVQRKQNAHIKYSHELIAIKL